MILPAVGLSMTTGKRVPLGDLVGVKFTDYYMKNPALVQTLRDRGIDARLSADDSISAEDISGKKQPKVYVQDPGDEIYVIRDANGEYIWKYKNEERLPDNCALVCTKFVIF